MLFSKSKQPEPFTNKNINETLCNFLATRNSPEHFRARTRLLHSVSYSTLKKLRNKNHHDSRYGYDGYLDRSVVLGGQNPVGSRAFPGDVEVNILASLVLHDVCNTVKI
jgi:hypothetical protein